MRKYASTTPNPFRFQGLQAWGSKFWPAGGQSRWPMTGVFGIHLELRNIHMETTPESPELMGACPEPGEGKDNVPQLRLRFFRYL